MSDLRTAAQQALDSINELFAAEQSEGGERGGHIRTPATREHLVRVAQARKALHESCGALRAALAQQAEPTVTEDMKSAVRWAPSSAYWSQRLREFFGPDAREGIDALERRLAKAQQAEQDLSRCPQCNGPADNGFDRSFPPSPYLCTKCMAEPVEPVAQQAKPVQEPVAGRAFLERILAAMEGVIDVADRKTDEFDALRSCVIDLTLMLHTTPPQRKPEPVQEPVAWMYHGIRHDGTPHDHPSLIWRPEYMDAMSADKGAKATPLYTTPPQRKPLPKHDQHCVDVPGYGLMAVRLVRAVERAHGIKE